MPVRRGPSAEDRTNRFDDFEVQHVKAEINGDTTDTGATGDENAHSFEPLGGLTRGEAAELVAMFEQVSIYPEDAGGLIEHVEAEWELSLDSVSHLINLTSLGDEVNTETDGHASGADYNTADFTDPDVLRYHTLASGTNSGTHVIQHYNQLRYRDWFGEGPVYDRHDELHYHVATYKDGAVGMTTSLNHVYVWDVFETDI